MSGGRVSVLPQVGATVPSALLRGIFLAVAVVAALVQFLVFPPALVVALFLAVAATIWPRTMLGWAFILLVGVSLFWHEQRFGWQLFVLLAALHALHVLGAQLLWLPWRSRIQASALRRPLLRFVAIQVPAQLVALLVLTLTAGVSGAAPWFAVLVALALVALALILARPLLREKLQARL